MKTKIEIKDIYGNALFTHEHEGNSAKETVWEAVRQNVWLRYANLGYADLHDAYLRGADLRGAYLGDANLRGADLGYADLRDAYLRDAYLRGACLRGACLGGADLGYADLGYANLHDADLRDAYLRGAHLRGAHLDGAKNIPFIPLACPSDGAFIGWKKVNKCIVKLLIPEDAKRSSATTGKCRCDKAKVLEITCMKTNEHLVEIANREYAHCVYKVGEMVYPDSFDDDRWSECSHGIHFFINRQEAVEYGL